MIAVLTGLDFPRSEMEMWFDRAMKARPDNYEACYAKLHYLKPQWYGSLEEVLAFGRECVKSKEWTGGLASKKRTQNL